MIPADIMDAALKAHDEQIKADIEDEPLIIARAILAERERCAQIARTHDVYAGLNVSDGGPEWYRHGQEIAEAIGRGEK